MSKMDALRAMREERYEQAQKRGASASPPRTAPAARTGSAARAARAARPAPVGPEPGPSESPGPTKVPSTAVETCGHKNMGGRTCTRPRGHAEKSHRYG